MDNCLIVPHIASASVATRAKMAEMAVDNLIAGFKASGFQHASTRKSTIKVSSRAALQAIALPLICKRSPAPGSLARPGSATIAKGFDIFANLVQNCPG